MDNQPTARLYVIHYTSLTAGKVKTSSAKCPSGRQNLHSDIRYQIQPIRHQPRAFLFSTQLVSDVAAANSSGLNSWQVSSPNTVPYSGLESNQSDSVLDEPGFHDRALRIAIRELTLVHAYHFISEFHANSQGVS